MRYLTEHKYIRGAISALMAAALLAALCLPVLHQHGAQPDNPITADSAQPIHVLQMGSGTGGQGTGDTSDPNGQGGMAGAPGGEAGQQGGSRPQEEQDDQQAAPEEKDENVEAEQQPQGGVSAEDLSQITVGAAPEDDNGQADQEDGDQGVEGDETAELDLALVLTWYKYGYEARTLVCQPNEMAGRRILVSQLRNDQLEYDFSLTGTDAEDAEILSVTWAAGNRVGSEVAKTGALPVEIPAGESSRSYIFTVVARGQRTTASGETTEQDMTFTVVLQCETGMDLDLVLQWQRRDGVTGNITCAANSSASRTVESNQLTDGNFVYSMNLVGENAWQAEIVSAEYWSASGQSGSLTQAGVLPMSAARETETYYIAVTAELTFRDEDGRWLTETAEYSFVLTYQDTLDLSLRFTWYERGEAAHGVSCDADERASVTVKHNQITGGSLAYTMELTGDSAEEAEIVSASCQDVGALSVPSGSIALKAAAQGAVTYTILVTARTESGRQVEFTVSLRYTSDVRLQMQYTVYEDGAPVACEIVCENKRTVTAETVYDDQLTDGALDYTFTLLGDEAGGMTITEVSCYQSGNYKTQTLQPNGSVRLLLNEGRTGENTFTVKAKDAADNAYTFTINVPFKHRGQNTVKIQTNLTDNMVVTNDTELNLTVDAWSEDAEGNIISYITATGTGTTLTVTLDGRACPFTSSSGRTQQYSLFPENDPSGDTNYHTLLIHAEDEHGNYGDLELTLIGKRAEAGQKKGTAAIYIDLSVIGLGVMGPVAYDVLADEPISYVVAKALWGADGGETFGKSENTFGLPESLCSYSGTLDTGFYLEAVGYGDTSGATALSGSWDDYGSTEEEILAKIDEIFGAGSDLAILWRCIYRNGLELNPVAVGGSVGEQDFTSGSGWAYEINGFYPGLGMTEYFLEDGDVLTLRYTLAYGWDIGNGAEGGYTGSNYCVTCHNGVFTVSHNYQQITDEETGAIHYQCSGCGMVEGCTHDTRVWTDLEDGTCVEICQSCLEQVGVPQAHSWGYSEDETGENHIMTCANCRLEQTEAHWWTQQESTATCTEPGVLTQTCEICGVTQQTEAPAAGHTTGGAYQTDRTYHWLACQTCEQDIPDTKVQHEYHYDEAEGDWVCVCELLHDWDMCSYGEYRTEIEKTCQYIIYFCSSCELELRLEGVFEDGHSYTDGICVYCGGVDPDYLPPEDEEEEETPPPEGGDDGGDPPPAGGEEPPADNEGA